MAICPVCGYPELKDNHKFDYCPSCRFQFNYTDDDLGYSYDQWRNKWIEKGMPWGISTVTQPANWDPVKQLENLSKIPKK